MWMFVCEGRSVFPKRARRRGRVRPSKNALPLQRFSFGMRPTPSKKLFNFACSCSLTLEHVYGVEKWEHMNILMFSVRARRRGPFAGRPPGPPVHTIIRQRAQNPKEPPNLRFPEVSGNVVKWVEALLKPLFASNFVYCPQLIFRFANHKPTEA